MPDAVRVLDWSEVPNVEIGDGGQCLLLPPSDGGVCTPIFRGIENCKFSTGACFSFQVDYMESRMSLPAGFPPPVAKLPVKTKPVPDMAEAAPVLPSIPSAPAVANLPGAVSMPSVPSMGAFGELGNLPAASNISPLTIVLALVAVGGGGAAWKFYSQRSKEKHEEAMLKIEKGTDSDAAKNDQQRQRCDSAAQWSREKIDALTARADASDRLAENAASNFEALSKRLASVETQADDVENLHSRLSALERKVSTSEKAVPKKSKGTIK